jgi:hypothetical protein
MKGIVILQQRNGICRCLDLRHVVTAGPRDVDGRGGEERTGKGGGGSNAALNVAEAALPIPLLPASASGGCCSSRHRRCFETGRLRLLVYRRQLVEGRGGGAKLRRPAGRVCCAQRQADERAVRGGGEKRRGLGFDEGARCRGRWIYIPGCASVIVLPKYPSVGVI